MPATAALSRGSAQRRGGASRAISSSRSTSFDSVTARTRGRTAITATSRCCCPTTTSSSSTASLPRCRPVRCSTWPVRSGGARSCRGSSSGWSEWWTTRGQRALSAVRPFTRCSATSLSGDVRGSGSCARSCQHVGSTTSHRPATSRHASSRSSLTVGCLRCVDRSTRATRRVGSAASTCAIPSSRWSWRSRASGSTPARSIVSSTHAGSSGWSEPAWSSVAGHRRPGVAPTK